MKINFNEPQRKLDDAQDIRHQRSTVHNFGFSINKIYSHQQVYRHTPQGKPEATKKTSHATSINHTSIIRHALSHACVISIYFSRNFFANSIPFVPQHGAAKPRYTKLSFHRETSKPLRKGEEKKRSRAHYGILSPSAAAAFLGFSLSSPSATSALASPAPAAQRKHLHEARGALINTRHQAARRGQRHIRSRRRARVRPRGQRNEPADRHTWAASQWHDHKRPGPTRGKKARCTVITRTGQ